MYKSLVFGDEFVAHLKSHQRCSAAFCRPVKFFHTDWIIISLWFLSYTQRHCHVRIEKSPNCCYKIRSTQFPRISLYAQTLRLVLMEITKVVKPFFRRGCQYFWLYSVCHVHQVCHKNLPCRPRESCLVWKWLIFEQWLILSLLAVKFH